MDVVALSVDLFTLFVGFSILRFVGLASPSLWVDLPLLGLDLDSLMGFTSVVRLVFRGCTSAWSSPSWICFYSSSRAPSGSLVSVTQRWACHHLTCVGLSLPLSGFLANGSGFVVILDVVFCCSTLLLSFYFLFFPLCWVCGGHVHLISFTCKYFFSISIKLIMSYERGGLTIGSPRDPSHLWV
jgi:hypothetical protein